MKNLTKFNFLTNIRSLKPILYALVLNQNYWLFGSIPTQVIALPLLLINLFLKKFSTFFFFIILFLQLSISSAIILGLNEYFKYLIIISCYLFFGNEIVNNEKDNKNLILSLILLIITFSFIPSEILLHPKIFIEYAEIGGFSRISGFCQDPNELASIFLLPILLDSFKYKKEDNLFTEIFCLTGLILSGSRTFILTFFLLRLNKYLKDFNYKKLFILFIIITIGSFYYLNSIPDSILDYKMGDIFANRRYANNISFIDNILINFSLYTDGVVPSYGNIHNQFLAFIPRFGIIGFLLSIVLSGLFFVRIFLNLFYLNFYKSFNYIFLLIPLLLFDFTMSIYLYVTIFLLNKKS